MLEFYDNCKFYDRKYGFHLQFSDHRIFRSKFQKYQVHYISQSKKDSVIVSTDVICNCLITEYSNQKCQKYQVYYILHSILITEYSNQKHYPLYYTSQLNYSSVKIGMQFISNFVLTEYSNQKCPRKHQQYQLYYIS